MLVGRLSFRGCFERWGKGGDRFFLVASNEILIYDGFEKVSVLVSQLFRGPGSRSPLMRMILSCRFFAVENSSKS